MFSPLFLSLLSAFGLYHQVAGLQYFHEKEENDWTLRMVHNVRWNTSKNFMFVHREKTMSMFMTFVNGTQHKLGKQHLGEDPCACGDDPNSCSCPLADAEMSFFMLMGQENMHIRFSSASQNESALNSCEIAIWPEEIIKKVIAHQTYLEGMFRDCTFQRKMYEYEEKEEPPYHIDPLKLHAFCPLDDHLKDKYPEALSEYPKWIPANGSYNKPSETPQCIFDFHAIAKSQQEYEFFKYCAKGYFFQGKEYNDPARLSPLRKDWLLYLAQGQVICQQSGNMEADRALMAKGYRVDLVHIFDKHRFYPEQKLCPDLEAVLVSYEESSGHTSGDFFLAAIVGSAQLEGEFRWKYVDENSKDLKKKAFWDQGTYKDEYAKMNLDTRLCYLLYHKMLKWNHGELINRFRLQLRVSHYCTDRGMRKTTSFDVSIAPEEPPDNVYEDRGIRIHLNEDYSYMERTTRQKLCSIGTENAKDKDCELAPEIEKDKRLAEHEKCEYSHDCASYYEGNKTGLLCRGPETLSCSHVRASDCDHEKACEYFNWDKPDSYVKENKCDYNLDLDCHDDEYCYFWFPGNAAIRNPFPSNECRKVRFKQESEWCFVAADCFPPRKCKFGPRGGLFNKDPNFGVCDIDGDF